jgi:hypothetical protein
MRSRPMQAAVTRVTLCNQLGTIRAEGVELFSSRYSRYVPRFEEVETSG